jgi:hypothetical protein
MTAPRTPFMPTARIAGACGVGAAALILAAPSLAFSEQVGLTVWLLGLLLLLPFFAGIAALGGRATGGRAAWLAPVVSAASAVLVSVQLAKTGIEYAANTISTSSPVHEPLHDIGGALFVLAVLPFGVALIACAVVAMANRTLPRWLTWSGLAVGGTALVNGTVLGTESVWGFLLGLMWVFAAGVTLTLRRPTVMPLPELSAAAT